MHVRTRIMPKHNSVMPQGSVPVALSPAITLYSEPMDTRCCLLTVHALIALTWNMPGLMHHPAIAGGGFACGVVLGRTATSCWLKSTTGLSTDHMALLTEASQTAVGGWALHAASDKTVVWHPACHCCHMLVHLFRLQRLSLCAVISASTGAWSANHHMSLSHCVSWLMCIVLEQFLCLID